MITTIIIAAIISCVGMLQVLAALSRKQREALLRHRGKLNLIMHVAVFYVFLGTLTGLIQAELCAIMLTMTFAAYAKKLQLEDKAASRIINVKPRRMTREQAKAEL